MYFNQTQKLKAQLAQAHALVSGRQVACIIETFNGHIYEGHNLETESPVKFFHAEIAALKQMRRDRSGIKHLILGGKGIAKIKQICPCETCWKLLLPHFRSGTRIKVYEPDLKNFTVLSKREMSRAYKPLHPSSIKGGSLRAIKLNLRKKTLLRELDLDFVAQLRMLGMRSKIHFYLVGTSSGRGAVSQLIKLKKNERYDDIDLIAVSKLPKEQVQFLVSELIKNTYPNVTMRCRKFTMYLTKKANEMYEYDQNGHKIIALSIGTNKRDTFLRKDYLKNNWFHQLS